jgi:hypothetical protein
VPVSVSRAEPMGQLFGPAHLAQLWMSLEPTGKLSLELIWIRARQLRAAIQLCEVGPAASSE